jgi:hypothetical protein
MVGFTLAIIVGAVLLVAFPFHIVQRKYLPQKYSKIPVVIGSIVVAYFIYRAIYPSDKFYLDEFKQITGSQNTDSIEVIYGTASYPIVHGDYCSAALLMTSEEKYDDVMKEIKSNTNRKEGGGFGCDEINQVIRKTKINTKEYIYDGSGKDNNNYYYIKFLPGNKMLSVKCNT